MKKAKISVMAAKKSALMQQVDVMQEQSKGEKAEWIAFLQDEFMEAVPRRHVIDAVIARLSGNDLMKVVNGFFAKNSLLTKENEAVYRKTAFNLFQQVTPISKENNFRAKQIRKVRQSRFAR